MDKEMKTMTREIKEDTAGTADTRGKQSAKKRISGSERGDERKRRKMASGEGRLDEKDENDKEKMEQTEKKERKNNVIITAIGGIRGNIERGVEEWLEREIGMKVNVKEAFKISKDKMMLAKIENWEQKKKIMLNKSKLKERER
jgi:hypothetical protein